MKLKVYADWDSSDPCTTESIPLFGAYELSNQGQHP